MLSQTCRSLNMFKRFIDNRLKKNRKTFMINTLCKTKPLMVMYQIFSSLIDVSIHLGYLEGIEFAKSEYSSSVLDTCLEVIRCICKYSYFININVYSYNLQVLANCKKIIDLDEQSLTEYLHKCICTCSRTYINTSTYQNVIYQHMIHVCTCFKLVTFLWYQTVNQVSYRNLRLYRKY